MRKCMTKARLSSGFLLGFGRSATTCGDQILEVMVIWTVWQYTQSSTLTAMAAFLQRAPFWLFGFIGATYTDREGATGTLRKASFAAMIICFISIIALLLGLNEPITITIASFAIGCARSFEPPALTAIVPAFSKAWSVKNLNNLLDNAKRLGRLIAPLPAMLLGVVPTALVIVIPAFAFSIMIFVSKHIAKHVKDELVPVPAKPITQWKIVKQIYGLHPIGLLFVCSAIYAFFHGAAYFALVPRVLFIESENRVDQYAMIIGAFAFGGIAANAVIAALSSLKPPIMVGVGMIVAGLTFLLLGQSLPFYTKLTIATLGGASLAFQDVFMTTLIQEQVPRSMLARAHALWRLGSEIGLGLGILVGGVAADAFSSTYLLVGVGVFIGFIGLRVLSAPVKLIQ